MKKLFILSISLLFTLSVFSQQTKVLKAEKANEYGLIYTLPVTALEITVSAERTVYKAGPYAKYAKKYLGNDKITTEDYESWQITDVAVRQYGTVDSETKYLMQLKPGSPTFISVDENGMILSINREVSPPAVSTTAPTPAKVKIPSGKEYLEFVDQDFIASQSSAKQAEMLASNILDVRDSRLALTRGKAETMPTDGKQLELMLNSLDEQENAMTMAFTGFSYKESYQRTFTYIPQEDANEILFRFSDFKGFCAANDYAGSPFTLLVNVTSQGSLPVDVNGNEKELPKDAVRYAIPGTAQIKLSHDNQTYYNKELEFGQMGIVFGLNPTVFTDKKSPSYAIFNPVTGGLSELGTLSK